MENSYVLRAILEAQDRSFSKAIANAIKSTNSLSIALEQVEKDVSRFDSVLNSSANGLDDLTKSSSDTSKSLGDIGDGASDVSNAMSDITDSSSDAVSGLSDVTNATGDVASGLSDVTGSTSDTVSGLNDVVLGLSDVVDSSSDTVAPLNDVVLGLSDVADSTSDTNSAVESLQEELRRSQDELEKTAEGADNASSGVSSIGLSISNIAGGALVFKAIEMAVSGVSGALDSAISRFDTLNQYPKTLENLGASGEEAASSMEILKSGVDGLPTRLDEVASTSQAMFMVFKDADYASESTIALNNALLASGSSSAEAARGTQQYLKMLQTGKVDMVTWNSLQQTMGLGLEKVSEEMLGAGASSQQLYSELQSGRISIDEFNGSLVGMSDELNTIALDSTKGIGTSIQNMQNAITRGTANSIEAIDDFVKEAGINADGIAGVFDDMKNNISRSFEVVNGVLKKTTPLFSALTSVVKGTTKVLLDHKPAVIGVATALATMKIANTVSGWMEKLKTSTTRTSQAFDIYTRATKSGVDSSTALSVIQKDSTVSTSLLGTALSVLSGKTDIQTAKTILLAKAQTALNLLTNPLTLGFGAIALAGAGLFMAYQKNTAEARALAKEQENLSKAIDDSSTAYEKDVEKINKRSVALEKSSNQLDDLMKIEKKTATNKNDLSNIVDALNNSIDGLNLSYNKETDSLNMSNEQLKKRIDLQMKLEQGNTAQERMNELLEEQAKATKNLDEAMRLQEGAQKQREANSDLIATAGERVVTTKAVQEAENNLSKVQQEIAQVESDINAGLQAEREILAQNQHIMIENQKIDYANLSDAQKEAFDQMKDQYDGMVKNATESFKKITEVETTSFEQILENRRENLEATKQWNADLNTLTQLAMDDNVAITKESMDLMIAELGLAQPGAQAQTRAIVNSIIDEQGNLKDGAVEKINEMAEGSKEAYETTNEILKTVAGEGIEPISDVYEEMSKESLKKLSAPFEGSELQELGLSITNGIAESISSNTDVVEQATGDMAETTVNQLKQEFSTQLPYVGAEIPNGLVSGIEKNSSNVDKASTKLAESLLKNFKYPLGINSPSKVMIENGGFITEGLTQGINKGSSSPISKMRELASQLPRTFDGLPNQMYSIGVNSMNQLAAGITAGGQNAINEAQKVADSIAKIMDSASQSVVNAQNKAQTRTQSSEVVSPQAMSISGNINDLVSSHIGIGSNLFRDHSKYSSYQPRDINVKVDNQTDGKILQEFKHIKKEISRIVDNMKDMKVVLDNNVWVGQMDIGMGETIRSVKRYK